MEKIRTDKNQVCLDLIETLLVANLQKETVSLIEMLQTHEPLIFSLSAIYADIKGGSPNDSATEGIAFPSRRIEMNSLSHWAKQEVGRRSCCWDVPFTPKDIMRRQSLFGKACPVLIIVLHEIWLSLTIHT